MYVRDRKWSSHVHALCSLKACQYFFCRLDGGCLDWQDQWKKFVERYGRYKHCYAKVKRAWVRIEEFIKSLAKDRPG